MSRSPEYMTDRALRVLRAAITGAQPEAVSPQNAELYERERRLGRMPIRQAFAELEEMVPQLAEVRTHAEEVARSPEAFGIERTQDAWKVPAGVLKYHHGLAGRDSHHPDPLVRSSVAGTIVAR